MCGWGLVWAIAFSLAGLPGVLPEGSGFRFLELFGCRGEDPDPLFDPKICVLLTMSDHNRNGRVYPADSSGEDGLVDLALPLLALLPPVEGMLTSFNGHWDRASRNRLESLPDITW